MPPYEIPSGFGVTYQIAVNTHRISTPNYLKYSAFAYIPNTNEDGYKIQIDAMLCAVELKIKTVNGYSSSCHGKFGPVWENHDSVSVINWAKEMGIDSKQVLLIK